MLVHADGIAVKKNQSREGDHGVLITKGELVFAGTPAELKPQGELLEKHLGV
jgi:ABC-type branched-subunit amino acid transport system ATPase component